MAGKKRDHTRRDCTCPRTRHAHGTYNAYSYDGCRCDPCTRAHTAALGARRREIVYGRWGPWVNPAGTVRRLQALAALGWPMSTVAAHIGVDAAQTRRLCRGDTRRRMHRDTAARVAAVYDRLSMSRPTRWTHRNDRIVAAAAAAGWVPPLAWDDDDIDNPDAQPTLAGPTGVLDGVAVARYTAGTLQHRCGHRYAPELLEAVRRMTAAGLADTDIGARVGMNRDAVTALRKRNHIPAAEHAA